MSCNNKPLIACFIEAWNTYKKENKAECDVLSDFTEEYVNKLDETHCNEIIREFGLKSLIGLMCKLQDEDSVYDQLLDLNNYKALWTEEALIRAVLEESD